MSMLKADKKSLFYHNIICPTIPLSCAICFETTVHWFHEKVEINNDLTITISTNNLCSLFCKDCLRSSILECSSYPITCPICKVPLSDDNVYRILKKEDHARFRRIQVSGRLINNKDKVPCYNCSTNLEKKNNDSKNQQKCLRCNKINCYNCKSIHELGQNCQEWQKDNSQIVEARKQIEILNKKKIDKKEGMYCPQCKIFIEFNGGCNYIQCSRCLLGICSITMQPRWGPGGIGDISGGCKCGVNGKKCHPNCRICH